MMFKKVGPFVQTEGKRGIELFFLRKVKDGTITEEEKNIVLPKFQGLNLELPTEVIARMLWEKKKEPLIWLNTKTLINNNPLAASGSALRALIAVLESEKKDGKISEICLRVCATLIPAILNV